LCKKRLKIKEQEGKKESEDKTNVCTSGADGPNPDGRNVEKEGKSKRQWLTIEEKGPEKGPSESKGKRQLAEGR